MKILFLSDVHLDVNQKYLKRPLVQPLVDYLREVNPDLWVFAGDLAGDASHTIELLEEIHEKTGVSIKFVPGNHDIWTDEATSWTSYELLKNHPMTLIDRPFFFDDYALLGDMGWYDHSFKPSFINDEDVRLRKSALTKDARYAKWGISDQEMYQIMHKKFEQMLENHRDKKVIFVNHFIPYSDFVTFKQDLDWNVANSFMGTTQLGELLDRYDNIETVVFGHTHRKFGAVDFGNKTIICNPLGYTGEWQTKSFEEELRQTGILIDY